MGVNWGMVSETGLQFFGKMSASISHEIRNTLAILNENAGLLEDYILMAEKGIPIDHERLKTLAQSMRGQIQRADGIVGNMNRFAHGVDESEKSVDLHEILNLLVALSGRFADMQGVKLDPAYPEGQILITTNPFFLENLLFCFLDFAMGVMGKGKRLGIVAEEHEKGVCFRFAGLEGLAKRHGGPFPSEREKGLIEALEADFLFDIEAGEIVVTIPKAISR